MEDPFRDYFKMNATADAFVGTGADGTLFIGSMNFFPLNATPEMLELEKEPRPGLLFGAMDIAWSRDEGKTWSSPEHVMGQYNKLEDYGPGVKPEFIGKTPYDRPFLVTDESTGTIYVPGNGSGGEPPHMETFIRASATMGRPGDRSTPTIHRIILKAGCSARPAAAHGVLGVVYVASSVPSNTGGKCPCLVFGASRDEGKTFDRHVVQYEFPDASGLRRVWQPITGGRSEPSGPLRRHDDSPQAMLKCRSSSPTITVRPGRGPFWRAAFREQP